MVSFSLTVVFTPTPTGYSLTRGLGELQRQFGYFTCREQNRDPWVAQPVVSRYTDYAVLAGKIFQRILLMYWQGD